jgi:outer membrane protein OmpA-like peptidoglycan-associated protein
MRNVASDAPKAPPLPGSDAPKPPIDQANHPERTPLPGGGWADLKALQSFAGQGAKPGDSKDSIAAQIKESKESKDKGLGAKGVSLDDKKDEKDRTSDAAKLKGGSDQSPAVSGRLDISVKDSMKSAQTAERALERQERISGAGVEGYSTGSDHLKPAQFARLEKSVEQQLGGQPLYGNDKVTLTLTGSTSRLGDADKNQALGQSRADNTAQMFRDRGFTGKIETVTHLSESKDASSDDPMERYILGEAKVEGDDKRADDKPVADKPSDEKPVEEKPSDAAPADDKPVSSDDFSKAVHDGASIPIEAVEIPWERIGEMAADSTLDALTSVNIFKAMAGHMGGLGGLAFETLAEAVLNMGKSLLREKASIASMESSIKESVMSNVGAGFADGVAQELGLQAQEHKGSRFDLKNPLYLAAVSLGAASVAGWSAEARKNIDRTVRDPTQAAKFLQELQALYDTRLNHEH